MQLVDNSNNRVIDRHKPRLQQHRRLAPAFVIHQLFGPGHTRGIARNNRLALRLPLFVKRLDPKHRNAFESRVQHARCERANDLTEQHQKPPKKSELRNPKEIQSSKAAMTQTAADSSRLLFELPSFNSCFGFRISRFEFPSSRRFFSFEFAWMDRIVERLARAH